MLLSLQIIPLKYEDEDDLKNIQSKDNCYYHFFLTPDNGSNEKFL